MISCIHTIIYNYSIPTHFWHLHIDDLNNPFVQCFISKLMTQNICHRSGKIYGKINYLIFKSKLNTLHLKKLDFEVQAKLVQVGVEVHNCYNHNRIIDFFIKWWEEFSNFMILLSFFYQLREFLKIVIVDWRWE